MLRKLILGIAALAVILTVWSFVRDSPRERILKNGPGPVDPDAPEEFTTTASGLRYRILREGDGRRPQPTDTVTLDYAGWLNDGKPFASSYGSQPLVTPLTRVIAGWTEGLQLVRENGMIELEVPSELGYGSQGFGSQVPPDAVLHYIVELRDVEPANEPATAGPRDPDAPQEFTTTDSGLRYRILRRSDRQKPRRSDMVRVHYKGWLDDGMVFDSSYKRGTPSTFSLNDGTIIDGLTEGLTHVGEGGMIELEVPSELGYGAGDIPGIPPHSTLHFVVEVLDVR